MQEDESWETDSGLARERTRLSWVRTAIAFAALGGVLLRREVVAGVLVLALTPLVWVTGRVASSQARPDRLSRRLLLVTVIVTLVAALAAAVAIFGAAPTSLHDLLPQLG